VWRWDGRSSVAACFFFQAEDGIRDWSVTGVQTCALPISQRGLRRPRAFGLGRFRQGQAPRYRARSRSREGRARLALCHPRRAREIGRASCREREEMSGGAVSLNKKRRGERQGQTQEEDTV